MPAWLFDIRVLVARQDADHDHHERVARWWHQHAVVYLPGRNARPAVPEAARPFLMYFREKNGRGIAYAESLDGYVFTEVADDPATADVDEGLVRIAGLPEGVTALAVQPTHVLQVAQNDLRMWAFPRDTSLIYLVSPNGID
jgi:hypothetical protein